MNIKLNIIFLWFYVIFGLSSIANAGVFLSKNENKPIGHLFIKTVPEWAKVRILNIKPKFHQGISLKPGKYLIEVSAEGYETQKEWIEIKNSEKKGIVVTLIRLPQKRSVPLFKDHIVLKGESLKKISERYHVTIDDIKRINNLKSTKLSTGQKLRIPANPRIEKKISDENRIRAEEYLIKGHSHLNAGAYKRAIQYYHKALRFNPWNVEAFYSLGLAYLKLGYHDKAVEHFQQTIVIDPYNSEAYYHLGLIYFIIGNKDASIEQYQILKMLDKELANRLVEYIKILK